MESSHSSCYDVLIIGAGVHGSATAYYLKRKLGVKKVLLLEQFSKPCTGGSSRGASRITRRAYDHPFYVKMMDEAFPMWNTLEKESQSTLYKKTGILVFGSSKGSHMENYKESLDVNGIHYRTLSGPEVNEKYSKQLSLPDDFTCILERDGGILNVPQAVQAFQKLYVSAGGELKFDHRVMDIVPGEEVTVQTNGGSFTTKRLIITTGPWTNKILRFLGVELQAKVFRPEVLYWKTDNPSDFSCDNFHTFIACVETAEGHKTYFYGIPIKEKPGLVKICHHSGEVTDPDVGDSLPFSSIEMTSKFVATYFKGVATTPTVVEPCLYFESPDRHPFIDRHPLYSNIVIGAGFSGHGFKLGPVVGKILSELSVGLHPSYDLSPFKINRLPSAVRSKL